MLVETLAKRKSKRDVNIDILTDISCHALVQGATEIPALLYLLKHHPNARITYLPAIHAKVYIANQSSAIVTSANFTRGGEQTNLEYGVKISKRAVVKQIQDDMSEYKKLSAVVTENELEVIHSQIEEIKKIIHAEQKHIAKTIKLHSIRQHRIIENNLIRTRVKGKSINSIFSETLLYLLSKKPSTTGELHVLVRGIHPDLCDDNSNRVIDGKTFGKLWKHQVRNAQQFLQRTNAIFYDEKTKLWHRTNS